MKKLSLALLAVIATAIVTLSSCHVGCIHGSGNSQTDMRKLSKFSKIDIEGAFKITLKQDSSYLVKVTADDNLQKYIHTVVDGNRLRVYSRKNLCNKSPMEIVIGAGLFDMLRGSGAIEISNDSVLNVHDLKLDFSGASKANLNISAANVETTGSGSTEIHLKGQAATHKVDFTGSGELHAFDFVTGDYDLHTTGASEIEINVLNSIKANTTGSAEIKYKGNPATIKNDKAGASEIKKVD